MDEMDEMDEMDAVAGSEGGGEEPVSKHQIQPGYGKREARINWSMVTCEGSTRYWNHLEEYWPYAGEEQLHDPIKSGLTR